MSHFVTLKTKFVSAEFLQLALADVRARFGLGELRFNDFIHGYGNNRIRGDLVLATRNAAYDVGFLKEGDTYDLKADPYGIRDFKLDQLGDALKQRYAYHSLRRQLEQVHGFSLVEEGVKEDQTIRLFLRRISV